MVAMVDFYKIHCMKDLIMEIWTRGKGVGKEIGEKGDEE